MTYTFYKTCNIDEFDSFVIHSKQNTLFQCSLWADVKNNWDHLFTCVKENDEIVATAMVLIRKLPLGKTLFYIPRGPVMDYNNHDLVSFMLSHLKEEAKKQHAIVLRFDPSILSRIYSYRDRNEEHDLKTMMLLSI